MGSDSENKLRKSSSYCSHLLSLYFKDYDSYHKTTGNKITHYFGISFIVVSMLGLLSHLKLENISPKIVHTDGALLLLFICFLWYLYLDWKIASPFILALFVLYNIGRSLQVNLNLCLFILGWILQGIGHYVYEKNSPAFFRNLIHLTIGPLWIFAKLIGYYR